MTSHYQNHYGTPTAPTRPYTTAFPQEQQYDHQYDDNQDEDHDNDDQGESKRRRIARACDMCRKKKIKCDGKMPKCGHCENYKTECHFTHVEKKRNPPRG